MALGTAWHLALQRPWHYVWKLAFNELWKSTTLGTAWHVALYGFGTAWPFGTERPLALRGPCSSLTLLVHVWHTSHHTEIIVINIVVNIVVIERLLPSFRSPPPGVSRKAFLEGIL